MKDLLSKKHYSYKITKFTHYYWKTVLTTHPPPSRAATSIENRLYGLPLLTTPPFLQENLDLLSSMILHKFKNPNAPYK